MHAFYAAPRWCAVLKFLLAVFGVRCVCLEATASAQSASDAEDKARANVVVLGLRTAEGDDQVAAAMTDALRAVAATVQDWDVRPRGPTSAQVAMAYGCEQIDDACLAQVVAGLHVDQLVHGGITRSDAHPAGTYILTLSRFDGAQGLTTNTVTADVPQQAVADGTFSARAAELVMDLSGQRAVEALGAVRIALDVAAPAQFYIDGTFVGESNNGSFAQEGVGVGLHTLSVEARGYYNNEASFEVTAGSATTVALHLQPLQPTVAQPMPAGRASERTGGDARPTKNRWLVYTLLGTSAASLIGMGASWLVIDSINRDEEFRAYSNAVYAGGLSAGVAKTDVCDEADAGSAYPNSGADLSDIRSMCRTGRTFEILQWVFLGTAVASGGAGAYLLLSERDEHPKRGATLSLKPSFSPSSARLDAKLTF